MKKSLSILALTLSLSGLALADPSHLNIPMPNMGSMAGDSQATQDFKQANSKMHEAMMIEYTNNTDVDFLKGMIAHHEGAVEMAKVQLQYGKDPAVKAFAQKIIEDQSREIKFMRDQLNKYVTAAK